jgi:hypothetical protein
MSAHTALARRHLAAAIESFHEAATVAADAGDLGRWSEAEMWAGVAGVTLGLWLIGSDRHDEATIALHRATGDARRSLGLARRLDRLDRAATSNAVLGLAAVALGRGEAGRRRAEVALLDARSAEQDDAELIALLALGGAAWRLGDTTESFRLLTLAERNAMRAGEDGWLLEVLREQLRALVADGRTGEAEPLAARVERLDAALADR